MQHEQPMNVKIWPGRRIFRILRTMLMAITLLGWLLFWSSGMLFAKAFDQGMALYKEAFELKKNARSKADLELVLTRYSQAFQILMQSGAEDVAAGVLNNMALIYQSLGQMDKSLQLYEQSLAIFKKLGDQSRRGRTLNNMALIYQSLGQMDKSLQLYEQSLAIFKKLGDEAHEAHPLKGMASIYSALGQYDKGLQLYEQSLAIFKKLGDRAGEATVLRQMAVAYADLLQYDKWLQFSEQSLAIFKKLGDRAGEREALNNLAQLHIDLGQYDKSLEFSEESLGIARNMGDVLGKGYSLMGMATVYNVLGEYDKAMQFYEKALAAFKQCGHAEGEGKVLNNMAIVYSSLGQHDKSLELHNQALAVSKRIGDMKGQGNSLNNMGRVYSSLGQYDKSLQFYEKARAIFKNIGVSCEAQEMNIADLYLTTGDVQRAESFLQNVRAPIPRGRLALYKSNAAQAKLLFEEQLHHASKNRDADNLFASHTGLGLAYEALSDYQQAADHYKEAIDLTEQMRESLAEKHRANFYEVEVWGISRLTPYKGLARVLIYLNKPREALKQSEKTRARTFAENLSQRAHTDLGDVPKDVLDRDAEVNNHLSALVKALQLAYEKATKGAIGPLEKHVKAKRAERDAHISMLRRDYPLFAATKYPQPMDLTDSALRDDEWLIEYEVTDSGICVYLVKGKQIVKALFKPIERKQLDGLVRKFMEPLKGVTKRTYIAKLKAFDLSAGKSLFDILLGDVLSELPIGVPVVIVPDDSLGVLPFEMLVMNNSGKIVETRKFPSVSGAEFFGDRNPISYYQSITALTLARTLGREKVSGDRLLVMADPVFDISDLRAQKGNLGSPNLSRVARELNETAAKEMVTMIAVEEAQGSGSRYPRLKETQDLANKLKSLYSGRCDSFTGLDATKETFLKRIAPRIQQYKEIVFATHGYFGKNLPGIMEPVLMLSAVPPGTDGYLRLSEVMGLRMNADIVALTACMSGLGRNISGEGVMGMGRAFQYAGAKSVLASLWSVHEDASVKLVERFFRHLKEGKSKLEALRLARNEVRKDGYDHPYFWAPFILVGEVGSQSLPSASLPAKTSSVHSLPKPQTTNAVTTPQSFMSPTPRDAAQDKELLEASRAGDSLRVKKLLLEGADPKCTDAEYRSTPLHWASFQGNREIVALLLQKGADVNARNKDSRTPLMMAAGTGHRDIVELLLRHKADQSMKDKDGKTALDWARSKRHKTVEKILSK